MVAALLLEERQRVVPRQSGRKTEDLRWRLRGSQSCCDPAAIRDIARAVGASPGLVRHHFGSKDELRKACVAYALEALHAYVERSMTDEGLNDPKIVAEARDPLHPYQRYLARATGASSSPYLIPSRTRPLARTPPAPCGKGQLIRTPDQQRQRR
jgi:Bacterial regulatory proteins, tetR family